MATIRRRSNSWQLIAHLGYDELGRQKRKTKSIPFEGVSKTQAMREAAVFEKQLLSRTHISTHNMTTKDIIEYWWRNYGNQQSPTTIQRNKELCVRIISLLGHIRVSKLKPKHIHLFIRELEKPNARFDRKGKLSSRSVSMHYKLLSSIFNKAVKWDLMSTNPCLKVDPPKQRTKPQPILQEEDLSRFLYLLLTEAPLHHQVFFMLAFTDGLRRSEICGIDEDNIDLIKGTLKITTTAVLVNGKVIYKDETKTNSSNTTMYLSPLVIDLLRRYLAKRRNEEDLLGIPYRTKIFTHTDGTPILPQAFTRWLHKFLEKHNLPQVNTQGFRKMAITYSMKKINLKEASQFGRHSNIDTTAKYYAEVLQSRLATPTLYLTDLVETALKTKGQSLE